MYYNNNNNYYYYLIQLQMVFTRWQYVSHKITHHAQTEHFTQSYTDNKINYTQRLQSRNVKLSL
jgi:hypothetical protein